MSQIPLMGPPPPPNYRNNINQSICNICLDPTGRTVESRRFTTSCGHTFCSTCIRRWTQEHDSCPYCRQTITNIDNIPGNGIKKVKIDTTIEKIKFNILGEKFDINSHTLFEILKKHEEYGWQCFGCGVCLRSYAEYRNAEYRNTQH